MHLKLFSPKCRPFSGHILLKAWYDGGNISFKHQILSYKFETKNHLSAIDIIIRKQNSLKREIILSDAIEVNQNIS